MKSSFLIFSFTIFSLSFLSGQTLCDTGYFAVAGQVVDACGVPISDLNILAAETFGNTLDTGVTDGQGFYTLCIESGKSGLISPVSPNDYTNGVSTLDEVVMERHILAQELFNSPLQSIAADVNATQTITSLDIVIVEKLILQEILEFENSPSWKYLTNASELTLSTAFEAEFVYQVNQINDNLFDVDFTAVKIGDVNQLGCNAAVTNTSDVTFVNEFALAPNPMNESTNVTFTLAARSNVELLITDILGREIRRSTETYAAGNHKIQVLAQTFPKNGIYLISLSDGQSQMTKRLIKN